jgi:DNA repair exonuclease SbcCD ATPase subunit
MIEQNKREISKVTMIDSKVNNCTGQMARHESGIIDVKRSVQKISTLEENIDKIKSRLALIENGDSSTVNTHSENIFDELKSNVSECMNKIIKAGEIIDVLRNTMTINSKDVKDLSDKVNSISKDIVEIQSTVNIVSKHDETIKSLVSDLEQIKSTNDEKKRELVNGKFSTLINEMNLKIETINSDMSSIKEKMKDQSKLNDLIPRINDITNKQKEFYLMFDTIKLTGGNSDNLIDLVKKYSQHCVQIESINSELSKVSEKLNSIDSKYNDKINEIIKMLQSINCNNESTIKKIISDITELSKSDINSETKINEIIKNIDELLSKDNDPSSLVQDMEKLKNDMTNVKRNVSDLINFKR